MAKPLTVTEARERFRDLVEREVTDLTPETTWQWMSLSAVSGFISGSLPEYSSQEAQKRLRPLMALLDAIENQINDKQKAE